MHKVVRIGAYVSKWSKLVTIEEQIDVPARGVPLRRRPPEGLAVCVAPQTSRGAAGAPLATCSANRRSRRSARCAGTPIRAHPKYFRPR